MEDYKVLAMPIGIAIIIGMTYGFSWLRKRYVKLVIFKTSQVLEKYRVVSSWAGDGYKPISYTVYGNFFIVPFEYKIDGYVANDDRNRLLFSLFLLNVAFSLTSILMPFFVIVSFISYHNNIFKGP